MTINAFEQQLAIALKQASITAAVGVIQNNPDMTLEDFYAVIHPQGVTESITLGELQAALTGQALPAPVLMPTPLQRAAAPPAPRLSQPPKVNCLSNAGQEAYHYSILQSLAAMEEWIRGPDLREYCGGSKGQFNIAMRKHLIPEGLVKTRGAYSGMGYAITAKGKKRAARRAPTASQFQVRERAKPSPSHRITGYREIVLNFLQQNPQWHSGEDVSNACGGTLASRRQCLKSLVSDGLVERNGEYTVRMRYRIVHLQ